MVLEIKKRNNVYDAKNKLLTNCLDYDVIKDSKYYFVMAITKWTKEECINIMHNIMKEFVINYDEEIATNIVQVIIKNYNILIRSYAKDENYEYPTKLNFSPGFNSIRDGRNNTILILACFYKDHVEPSNNEIDYITYLENYMDNLFIALTK